MQVRSTFNMFQQNIARSRGQHVVNICSSHPPSDGLAQRALKIKPERLKNRSKSSKRRSKSLDSSYLRPWSGPTGNIFNICKATGRFNIQPCCQHLQRMVPTFQHQQLQRGRQRFPRWLFLRSRAPAVTPIRESSYCRKAGKGLDLEYG